jgi:ketosteroid isomerase-like protein
MTLRRSAAIATKLAAALCLSALAATLPAATPEEDAVLAPVHALFDGLSHHDAAAFRAAALPGTVFILMRDGKPTKTTVEAFADHVAKLDKTPVEEHIHDPLVKIDNDLAVVWAPFDFLVNGKVDHCGTDLFNLVKSDGKWRIAGVADTSRKDCPAK